MRKLITTLVIMVLLAALAPSTVQAASVTGQGKGGNTAPTVDALTIVQVGSDTQETAMSPLTEYRVKVTLGDINTIADITDIEFHVYNTSDGGQSASSKWNAAECAIFKWNKGTGLWTMENGAATTTWVLESGDSIAPSVFTGTTGDWYLAFRPGKLAQQDAAADWHAWVRADDENKNGTGSTETLSAGATMAAYSEINIDAATIVFGNAAGIEPGQTGYIETPVTNYLTSQVISNATHSIGIASELTWDDGGSNTITLSGATGVPVTSGQFSLEIDDAELGSPGQPKTPQAVTSSNVTITGLDAEVRTPVGDDAVEGTSDTQLWMALSFAADGVDEVTYEGIITFTVTA